MKTLVVGSRGSLLALRQTQQIVDELTRIHPDLKCVVKTIRTTGDTITDVPLARIGETGVFVTEIEAALMRGEIDLAVHSAKDLPSEMDDSLTIAAFCEREDPSDVLISSAGTLEQLPTGARVGTSSPRRRAQLLSARPDINIVDIRGNLDTRLRKVRNGDYAAVVLALAGLRRMGWENNVSQILPFAACLPAAGQGAIAIQCRSDDPAIGLAASLDHAATRACVAAERALISRLGAGCHTPVAALARVEGGALGMDALVASVDGAEIIRRSAYGNVTQPVILGRQLADELLETPAATLLARARENIESDTKGVR